MCRHPTQNSDALPVRDIRGWHELTSACDDAQYTYCKPTFCSESASWLQNHWALMILIGFVQKKRESLVETIHLGSSMWVTWGVHCTVTKLNTFKKIHERIDINSHSFLFILFVWKTFREHSVHELIFQSLPPKITFLFFVYICYTLILFQSFENIFWQNAVVELMLSIRSWILVSKCWRSLRKFGYFQQMGSQKKNPNRSNTSPSHQVSICVMRHFNII